MPPPSKVPKPSEGKASDVIPTLGALSALPRTRGLLLRALQRPQEGPYSRNTPSKTSFVMRLILQIQRFHRFTYELRSGARFCHRHSKR